MVSETMSPDHHHGNVRDAAESAGVDATAQFQSPDDRWVCIPSGIVERHKAQFEAPGADGSTEPCNSTKPVEAFAAGSDATPRMELYRESSACSMRYEDACQSSSASTGESDRDVVHRGLSALERAVAWTDDEEGMSTNCSRRGLAERGSRKRAQSL